MILRISDIAPAQPSDGWVLSPLRSDVRRGVLTTFVTRNRVFRNELLPGTRRALRAMRDEVARHALIPASPTTQVRNLYGAVGCAVGVAARYLSGCDVVGRPIERLRELGARGKALARPLQRYDPPKRAVFRRRDAIGWFLYLGMLERIVLGVRPTSDADAIRLPDGRSHRNYRDWFADFAPADVQDELLALLRALSLCRLPGHMFPSPTFAGIGPISVGIGDWIAGRTLVELKVTTHGPDADHVAQLLMYRVLSRLPLSRRLNPPFTSLALCLPRQSCTFVGTPNEWLACFGAPPYNVVERAVLSCIGGNVPAAV
jgi:hypothetical protein